METKTEEIKLRCTPTEKRLIQGEAAKNNMTMSKYILAKALSPVSVRQRLVFDNINAIYGAHGTTKKPYRKIN